MNPRLTTVKFSSVEMGRRAGQMIVELAQKQALSSNPCGKGDLPPQTVMLSVELVVRASTAPPKQ